MDTTNYEYRSFRGDVEVRKAGDGRTIHGIVVPYGRPTEIEPGLREDFAPGVIAHQMRATDRIKLGREHIPLGGTLIGRGVAGTWRDDAAGLYGELRVARTPVGDETLELVKDGALDELSVGFHMIPGGSVRTASGTILRTKVNMFEVAVVQEGAYGQAAKVAGVRSRLNPLPALDGLDQPERDALLREVYGELDAPGLAELRTMLVALPPLLPHPLA